MPNAQLRDLVPTKAPLFPLLALLWSRGIRARAPRDRAGARPRRGAAAAAGGGAWGARAGDGAGGEAAGGGGPGSGGVGPGLAVPAPSCAHNPGNGSFQFFICIFNSTCTSPGPGPLSGWKGGLIDH